MAKKKAKKKAAKKRPVSKDTNQIAFEMIRALEGNQAGGKRGTFGKGK